MWDCDMVFLVPESNFDSVTFKVKDKDTIGKDKLLGKFKKKKKNLFTNLTLQFKSKEYWRVKNGFLFFKSFYNLYLLYFVLS